MHRRYTKSLAINVVSAIMALMLLSGCILSSGLRQSTDIGDDAGNSVASFIGAEGSEQYSINVGQPNTRYTIILTVAVESGELYVDMIEGGSGTIAFSVQGRPDEQVTRTGTTATDARGMLYYRINARAARNGSYQILYQRTP